MLVIIKLVTCLSQLPIPRKPHEPGQWRSLIFKIWNESSDDIRRSKITTPERHARWDLHGQSLVNPGRGLTNDVYEVRPGLRMHCTATGNSSSSKPAQWRSKTMSPLCGLSCLYTIGHPLVATRQHLRTWRSCGCSTWTRPTPIMSL